MARGEPLAQLITDTRAELGYSLKANHGPANDDLIRARLRSAQETLWYEHEWPFLQVRPSITLEANKRFYEVPEGITWEGINRVELEWNRTFYDLDYGIGPEQYSAFDSAAGEVSFPVERWEMILDGGQEWIEFWPMPANAGDRVDFYGKRKLDPFTDDAHTSTLDGRLLVLSAATTLANSRDDREMLGVRAAEHLRRVLAANVKMKYVSPTFLGGRRVSPREPGRIITPR